MLRSYAQMSPAEMGEQETDGPLNMLLVHFGLEHDVLNNITCMRDLYRLVSLSSLHMEVRMRSSGAIRMVRRSGLNSIDVSLTCEICGTFLQSEVGRIAFLSRGCHRQRLNVAGLR